MTERSTKLSLGISRGSFFWPPLQDGGGLLLLGLVVLLGPWVTGKEAHGHNDHVAVFVWTAGVVAGVILIFQLRERRIFWNQSKRLITLALGSCLMLMVGILLFSHHSTTEPLVFLLLVGLLGAIWLLEPFAEWGLGAASLWGLAVFLIACLVAGVTSAHPHVGLLGDPYRHTGLLSLIACVLLFLLSAGVFANKASGGGDRVRFLLLMLFLGSAGVAILAWAQFFFPLTVWGDWFRELEKDPRPLSSLGHPNWLGTYLCLVLPLACWSFFYERERWKVILWALLCGLLFGALLLAQTRGAWLAFAVVGLCGFWSQRARMKRLLILGAIFLAVGWFLLPQKNGQIYHRMMSFESESRRAMEGSPGTGSGRFRFWQHALEYLPQHWLIGSGLDTYLLVAESDDNLPPLNKAHSLYLEYALTIGVPGMLAYLVFLGGAFGVGKRAPPDSLLWGLRASLMAYLAQGVFIHDTISNLPLIYVLAGLACAQRLDAWRANTSPYEELG